MEVNTLVCILDGMQLYSDGFIRKYLLYMVLCNLDYLAISMSTRNKIDLHLLSREISADLYL